jgi:3'-phosphoadenosine 5'-phosphosulfate sulfotransferase (PAPS reductase)/FAD synthetase
MNELTRASENAIEAFMARHANVALMFSAGKDSAACLELLRPWLSRVVLMWCNPGRPYPEVVEYMARVQREVPRFVEVTGNQPAFVAANGWPADLVPWEATPVGRLCKVDGPKVIPLVQPHECRWANMWAPALDALRVSGCSGVVRGEKLSDRPLAMPLAEFHEGREYLQPLLAWTDAQVLQFLGDRLPPGYRDGLSGSLDCMTCTAFLARNPERLRYLRERHPEVYAEVAPVLRYMREATEAHLGRVVRIEGQQSGNTPRFTP